MRTVPGRTDRVVVVGAGLAGLSAALHLAGAGRAVTVVERADVPGGRAGVWRSGGYAFDTGPTVLTMPELLEQAFAAVGATLRDHLELVPLDPLYRALFPDGSTLDVRPGTDAMASEVERVCGGAEAAGYRRYVEFVSELYRLEMNAFIDRNFDRPWDLDLRALARLAAMGGLRRLAPKVGSYLKDPRTRRLLSFQAMYAGMSPYDALAIYAVISYMDSVAGVYFPRGGMQAVPQALAAAAANAGVDFHYGRAVSTVDVRGGRAHGVILDDGERIRADAVVLTGDAPVALRELLPDEAAGRLWNRRLPKQKYSPSCFLLLAGSDRAYPGAAHHTISFGRAWRRTFTELIERRELMSDPSLLVTCATASDPALAPAGRHTYYVLAPTPNLDARLDWSVVGPRYRDELVETLEQRGWIGFGSGIEVEQVTTPAGWRARGMERGAPFAAAHSFSQTGPFRLPNLLPGVENVVLAGSGTVPGVGVPMVLVSGRLAAQRIAGINLVERHPRTGQAHLAAPEQPARRRVVVTQPAGERGKL